MKIREIIVENNEEDMFGQSDRVGNDLRRATYQQRIPSMIKMILGNLEANAGPFIKQVAVELGRDADVFRRDPEIFELADDLLTQEVMPQVSNILLSLDPVTISDEDALNNALTDHVANIRNGSDLWIYIEEILGDGDEDAAYMCAMTIEGEIGALLLKVIQQAYAQPGLSEGEIDEGVNDPHIFKCIFLFGPMGAGKSTVAGPLLSHTGLRSVNLDNFNEMFIKKGQVPTGHLAPNQLEKSWQLSQTQQNNFADARLGVIIDGSGRSTETAIGVLGKLQPLGYEFMMIFVNVSEATSIARQQSRAAKQQQQWGVGRQVDPTLAKNTYDPGSEKSWKIFSVLWT
jgi:adenylate kinase family enzyme